MAENPGSTDNEEGYKEPLRYFVVIFVAIAHINPFYRIVICSTDMAVAFNIPVNNIGIYFSKLSGIRSLTMSLGFTLEYVISKISEIVYPDDKCNDIRKYMSVATLELLTACEIAFVLVLHFSKNVSFHNYIVLTLEAFIFGLFQISMVSLTSEYASYYNVSLYISGTIILVTQTIIDRCCKKDSVLSVKIQSWICVIFCVISMALWAYYVSDLYKEPTNTREGDSQGSESTTCKSRQKRSLESPTGPAALGYQPSSSKIDYFMSMSSLSILKIMRTELNRLCTCTDNRQQITNVQFLINVLDQIRSEDEICTRLFIKIDFLIVGLKEICCLERETTLLEQLVFVLRGKYIMAISKCRNELTQEVTLLQPEHQMLESSGTECEKSRSKSRRKRQTSSEGTVKPLHTHLLASLSQFTMFGAGSLVKDFLFPAILPYALLERDKCHVINLITIIFLAIGPITIVILTIKPGDSFKKDNTYIHTCWIFMIPKIVIFIISLCAIHTKRGFTHKTRNSQPIILFMTVMLLMFYGFMETVSVVGVSNYVEHLSDDKQGSTDLQAIQRIATVLFRYIIYKLSVGYNNTRVNAGFVLPNFKPPEPIPDTFCYWFKGSFSNGWKDLVSDFKLNIKQYL